MMPNRRILRLTGKDTESFLQGLVTNDVKKLDKGKDVSTQKLIVGRVE